MSLPAPPKKIFSYGPPILEVPKTLHMKMEFSISSLKFPKAIPTNLLKLDAWPNYPIPTSSATKSALTSCNPLEERTAADGAPVTPYNQFYFNCNHSCLKRISTNRKKNGFKKLRKQLKQPTNTPAPMVNIKVNWDAGHRSIPRRTTLATLF